MKASALFSSRGKRAINHGFDFYIHAKFKTVQSSNVQGKIKIFSIKYPRIFVFNSFLTGSSRLLPGSKVHQVSSRRRNHSRVGRWTENAKYVLHLDLKRQNNFL